MALASRTEQPDWARELVGLLGIADRFAFSEIYPSSKLKHFAALRDDSRIDYDEMLFFDDETRNIRDLGSFGVTCVHVGQGMAWELFREGHEQFAARS